MAISFSCSYERKFPEAVLRNSVKVIVMLGGGAQASSALNQHPSSESAAWQKQEVFCLGTHRIYAKEIMGWARPWGVHIFFKNELYRFKCHLVLTTGLGQRVPTSDTKKNSTQIVRFARASVLDS
jgi:hypothetical protein